MAKTAETIYAFTDPKNTGKFDASFVQVIGVFNSPANLSQTDESIKEYTIKTGDFSFVSQRQNFFVEGDIFHAKFLSGSNNKLLRYNVSLVSADTFEVNEVGLPSLKYTFHSFSQFAIFFDLVSLKRTTFAEIKISSSPLSEKQKTFMQSSNITDLENDIFKLNQDILDLNTVKNFLTPLQFEEKIKISNTIDQLQKNVNKNIFTIVEEEAKAADDDIISKLFENSFKGIEHDYSSNVEADAEGLPEFFAPNGEPSKLSNGLNFIIRTPQFKSWFGDWQLAYDFKDDADALVNCSKIVNKNGQPEIYWHGAGVPFSYFKFDTFPAAYFAKNKEYSRFFSELHGGNDGYLLPFFLNVRNPLDLRLFRTNLISSGDFFDFIFVATGMDANELQINPISTDPNAPPLETWIYLRNNAAMLIKISQLFDGILFYETNPNKQADNFAKETEAVMVFSPHQIKLATDKRGDLILSSLRSFLLSKGGKI